VINREDVDICWRFASQERQGPEPGEALKLGNRNIFRWRKAHILNLSQFPIDVVMSFDCHN
jgi:predicted ribosome quality control (RQC) complex YloA/Tae2 family protein